MQDLGVPMKWRNGVFTCCPFCDATRNGSGWHEFPDWWTNKRIMVRAKIHHYSCGCVIIENYTVKREYLQTNVVSACHGAMLVLSKAMNAIVNEKDLTTWASFKQHYYQAKKSANYISYMMHKAASQFMVSNDVWRLPPIPTIRSLTPREKK